MYRSQRRQARTIYRNAVLSLDAGELLCGAPDEVMSPLSLDPDGKFAVYGAPGKAGDWDLWKLPLDGSCKLEPFIATPFNEVTGCFSPDGKWVAFMSDQEGQYNIHVASFPDGKITQRISGNEGGGWPRWRGEEIFYVDGNANLTARPIKLGAQVDAGDPQTISEIETFPYETTGIPFADYDVTLDGKRFIVVRMENPRAFTVISNWPALLRR